MKMGRDDEHECLRYFTGLYAKERPSAVIKLLSAKSYFSI